MASEHQERGLSYASARACEEAKEDVCRCRCGGKMHGLRRVREGELYSLPEDDPHHISVAKTPTEFQPPCPRCGQPPGPDGFQPSRELPAQKVCAACHTDEGRLAIWDWWTSTRPVLSSWPGTLHAGRTL